MYWLAQREESLENFLSRTFHGASKTALRSWLKLELIHVNARPVKRLDIIIEQGDVVERVEHSDPTWHGISIVYRDDDLLILDKPEGMLTVDTDDGGKKNLFSLLKERYGSENVWVVHRLDRETSGLIAFALNEEAHEALKEQLHDHLMQRRYMAVVQGTLDPSEGAWELELEEQPDLKMRVLESGVGEAALSFYRTLDTKEDALQGKWSLLEVALATGKKHQIRVSCAHAGCPIIGDERYGGPRAGRVGLHAYALSLFHPTTGQSMEWISPSVDQFERWWKKEAKKMNELNERYAVKNEKSRQQAIADSLPEKKKIKKPSSKAPHRGSTGENKPLKSKSAEKPARTRSPKKPTQE